MQTKFGNKLVNFARKGSFRKNDINIIMLIYFAFTLNVYIIPADILEKFPFLWQFCKFIASFVPLIEKLILYQAPGNIIFYFSYMTIFFLSFFVIYIYKLFFHIFGNSDYFNSSNWRTKKNPKESPIFFTIGWICVIAFFIFYIYQIYNGLILDSKVSPLRGTSKLTFIQDILQGGKFSSAMLHMLMAAIVWFGFLFLFSLIRLNFCEKLNIKRLKLKLFLIFCVFVFIIWVLKYYYAI
ncbi:hypothetical protein [Campylobacter corcagiensis]|uniref:Uncharacterized protein n=1 Tax=Campylobacter corcagiensis TaxID=1448857 RepID=A0A7M1LHZ0_9BACT|nr:hypothetical protein [Campylobacter corcagiensis]QKF65363.1 putative membrane protein [Campylobacter corcagiensis]QOQ88060.1 hypothetical protein IMC76_04525 [Campylobacter corcagiensis]